MITVPRNVCLLNNNGYVFINEDVGLIKMCIVQFVNSVDTLMTVQGVENNTKCFMNETETFVGN